MSDFAHNSQVSNDINASGSYVNSNSLSLEIIANKYVSILPHDIRPIVNEIIKKLEIDLAKMPPTIKLDKAEVTIPSNLNSLNYAIEALLYRTGYANKLGDKLSYVVLTLMAMIREYIENASQKGYSITVEVKYVTDRERLAYQIATQILNEYTIRTFYITSSDKQIELGIYCYDGLIYRPCEKEVISRIAELVSADENLAMKTTRWVINEALFKIKSKTYTRLHYEPMKIAFRNVLFDWEIFKQTLSLRRSIVMPNPDTIVFHKIPHRLPVDELDNLLEGLPKYDESLVVNADIEELAERLCPKTLKAYKSWVGDKWILLFEVEGAILIPEPIKKAFLLTDTPDKIGDTGKSTYIRYLQKLIGKENYTTISLQELTNPEYRFRAARIYRKLANFYPDLPEIAVRNVGNFKVVTGEDYIPIEMKHKDPFEWLPYTKHIFSANEPPPVFNADRAFWRRWIVIEFIGDFKERIKDFENTLLDEAPYSLLVSIIAFGKVIKRGWKFSFEDTPEDAKKKWMMRSDSVYAFFTTMIENGVLIEDSNGRIRTSELYNMYAKWCNENDMNPIDHRVFPNHIRKILGYRIKRESSGTYVLGLRKGEQRVLEL